MSRRTYSILAIARRHPRLFAALHASAAERADVRDGSDGQMLPNAAMSWQTEADRAIARLSRSGEWQPIAGSAAQWWQWANVPWRSDAPTRRAGEGPRCSRFVGELTA